MFTEIYGDVYMLINFTMDYIALYITSKILKRRTRQSRMIFASVIGAVYALLSLIFLHDPFISLLFSVVVGGIMSLITFGKKGLVAAYLVYIMSSFLLGGVMTIIFSALRKIIPGQSFSKSSASGGFFIAAFISFSLSLFLSELSQRFHSKSVCSVSTEISGIKIEESALCDSGNLLREPISGLPVVILCNSLSEKILKRRNSSRNEIIMNDLPGERIRIIPSKISHESSELLMAVIPKHFYVDGVDMMCAVAFGTREDFGGYPILVPDCITHKQYK